MAVNDTTGIGQFLTERTRSHPGHSIAAFWSRRISVHALRPSWSVAATDALRIPSAWQHGAARVSRPAKLGVCLGESGGTRELGLELARVLGAPLAPLAPKSYCWQEKRGIIIVPPTGVRIENRGIITSIAVLLLFQSSIAVL